MGSELFRGGKIGFEKFLDFWTITIEGRDASMGGGSTPLLN